MCTVAAASGTASVRVWQITSSGRGPRGEQPLPEGTSGDYPLEPVLPDNRETRPLTGDSPWDSVLHALYISGGRTICGLAGPNTVSQQQL